MATKLAKMGPMGGMHTSGIFSDMTVDGPEIGTLVVIVDRAKNLPNRKTMGKQDPYCAARLGKEAKKTETDRRGGQTPRWDQELRFTVHESPDYYSLKVSVFNDDKKTELIGESWVQLQDVVTPGGGKSDTWHSLNCKGKYAGEIRLELTYYDIRPKEEKVVERKPVRSSAAASDVQLPTTTGPREITPVKRRPLPTNPAGAASPSSASRNYHTPPRQQPVSQPQSNSAAHRHSHYSSSNNNQRTPDDRRALPDWGSHQTTHRHVDPPRRSSYYEPEQQQQQQQQQRHYEPQHVQAYANSPEPTQAIGYYDTPPRQQESEYPTAYAHDDLGSQQMGTTPPVPRHVNNHRQSPQPPTEEPRYIAYSPARHGRRHSFIEQAPPQQESAIQQHQYSSSTDLQQPSRHSMYQPDPAEQYNGNSYSHGNHYRSPSGQFPDYDGASSYSPGNHHHYRTSSGHFPDYHEPPTGHSPIYQQSSVHNPHDGYGGPSRGGMQATVEDDDDVPPPPPVHRSSAAAPNPYETPPSHYQPDPAPAPNPYDIPPSHYQPDLTPAPLRIAPSRDDLRRQSFSQDYGYAYSQVSAGGHSRPVSRDSGYHVPIGNELVPAYDINARHRRLSQSEYNAPPTYSTSPRPHPLSHHDSVSPQPSPVYQDTPETSMALVRARGVSPVPDLRDGRMPSRSTPTRKSVSPRPPPSSHDSERRERRLSGIPFSPDSFDELNPRVAASKSGNTSPNGTPSESIVGFDGRAIDPSDHLPVDSWAPEPEPKGKDKDRSARPTRERLVMGAREIHRRDHSEREGRHSALSIAGTSPSLSALNGPTVDSSPLVPGSGSGGRNRLQKKPRSGTGDSMILASGAGREYDNSSALTRVSPNVERHVQLQHYAYSPSPYSSGMRTERRALPPPIPAKVPLNAPEVRGDELARLSAEMSTIDIGIGTGTRRMNTRGMGAGRVRDGMGISRYG